VPYSFTIVPVIELKWRASESIEEPVHLDSSRAAHRQPARELAIARQRKVL